MPSSTLSMQERDTLPKMKKSKKSSHHPSTGDATVESQKSIKDIKSKKSKKDKKSKKKEFSSHASDLSIIESVVGAHESKKRSAQEGLVEESKKSKSSPYEYVQSPALESLSQSTIDAFLKKNQITISHQKDGLKPILEFSQVDFPKKVAKVLSEFDKPTAIQSVSWPPILSGQDLIGIAATGSGKTLAFGIPAFLRLKKSSPSSPPKVLVLSPTRELAMQIQEQFEKFGKNMGVYSVCIYGGVPKHEQKAALKSGVGVIVATPGRLLDLVETDGACDLSFVDYLVLDEADRMLDFGFEEAIRKIVSYLPKSNRQTVMFSATWPVAIQKMAASFLNSPAHITVGSLELSANTSIEQRVEVLDPFAKEARLLTLLKDYHKSRSNRILIFALYKKEAARLESFLKRNGYKVAAIHGDLGQVQRSAAIEGFKNGTCPLLIATDVAARGIDIPNVEYVINVTFPLTIEDYCHRIGRTGRAGKTGISHSFFTLHDKTHSGALINVLKQAGQVVPPELLKFGTTVKKKVDPNYGAFTKDVDMNAKPTKITFDDSD